MASSSGSGVTIDAIQMLQNLATNYPAFWALANITCWLLGIVLMIRAVYYLKLYGELRTMTASQTSLRTPATYLIGGSVFLFLPAAISVFNKTIFNQPSILGYNQISTGVNPVVMAAIGGLVQLIGFVAFIRGWMILVANSQQSGGQQHSFGKAITHIIGGFLLINVYAFASVIWNTFGLN